METRKTIDEQLKIQIGSRLKELIKDNKDQHTMLAKEYGIPLSTFNTWLAGISYPPMQFLIKLAGQYKVSLDWILTGQESLLPKDQRESDFIIQYRSLVERGISEPLEEFMEHQLHKARAKDEIKALRVRAGRAFNLDTFGKRLRYVRESQEGQTPAQMAEHIGLTEADYIKIEADEVLPGTQVLTALTGVLMDEETHDQSIMDWLLEGKG